MHLTPHFQLAEFHCHDGTPVPPSSVPAVRALCADYLEALRGQFGRTDIISGYRTAAHNRQVGGAPQSFHIYDRHPGAAAADVRCARGTPRAWYELLEHLGAGGLGAYTDHVHVDNRRGRARW